MSGASVSLSVVAAHNVKQVDETASRLLGVIYTNPHPRPLIIQASIGATNPTGPSGVYIYIDGVALLYVTTSDRYTDPIGYVSKKNLLTFVVPVGSTYEVRGVNSQPVTIQNWVEI